MDIFKILEKKTSHLEILNSISNYGSSNGYTEMYKPFHFTMDVKGILTNENCMVNMYSMPWPSYNDIWSNGCINICKFIIDNYPFLEACHLDEITIKAQASVYSMNKCFIVFIDRRDIDKGL